ncbi:23S rRNA pseudouridine(955/2504/2580) synthase [Alkalilimnicola ehrlichii]|uniref:Pseudouridine synthase n=1 Tax=Alkalilimnicola ehrlichii TaxID=351052 RepID=A0A3E0WLY4_9GAMM|nr:23S rRNA pseudouridine(955/2504/2580) synthase [Alkalilimnicola ehrlichii]RFA33818.1 23S rRNA pseudouridine(955/2504/2580) synthase [Alkalilimnicola ehrlichii]
MNKSSGVRYLRVDREDAGQRIDNFLLRVLKGVPKSRIYRLLRKGEVRVNKGRIGPPYRLQADDEVRIPPVRQEQEAVPDSGEVPRGLRAQLEQALLYEDDRLIVLNKPSGVAVHGGSGIRFGVIEAFRQMRPHAGGLELVHRLDRETSGCLMLAKRRSALRALHECLREGAVEKKYLALLAGKMPRGSIPVEAALRKQQLQGGERMVKVADEGKASRTVFRTLERYPGASLVEADIATGRTHQIRVHSAHLGHPVLGDSKYGERDANRRLRQLGLKRLFLHAHSLRLRLPWSEEELVVSAPLSDDLRQVLQRLERDG